MDKFLKTSAKRTLETDSAVNAEVSPSKNLKVTSKFDDLENYLTDKSWHDILDPEFKKDYWNGLKRNLVSEDTAKKTIYPPIQDIFNAFNTCPFPNVKVVILGQDPYHGPDQAHGLSFSVKKGVTTPPSLVNIYKELKEEYPNYVIPKHGYLQQWCSQGVFLLNATMTVEKAIPNSHEGFGWHPFTDKVIKLLGSREEPCVFLLWGKYAQKKEKLIDSRHCIISCAHPSPFSARTGFFGSKCFIKCNEFLEKNGKTPIDWKIE